MVEKTDILDESPRLGKVVPEIQDGDIRELHIYSYRIFYQIKQPNIEILAVIHKRRNFQADDI